MATPPPRRGNQKPLVVRDKDGRLHGELGVSNSVECDNFSLIILLGRLPKVDLIILEGGNVRPSVRTSVRPSTESFFDFNEIWYTGRGR